MLTKEQLLKPQRAVHPLALAEFPKPVLLGTPTGLLSLRLRELRARGVSVESEEALTLIVADMVVDESGAQMLSREEASRFIAGLSLEAITALLVKFTELVAPPKGAEPVPTTPSTSAT